MRVNASAGPEIVSGAEQVSQILNEIVCDNRCGQSGGLPLRFEALCGREKWEGVISQMISVITKNVAAAKSTAMEFCCLARRGSMTAGRG